MCGEGCEAESHGLIVVFLNSLRFVGICCMFSQRTICMCTVPDWGTNRKDNRNNWAVEGEEDTERQREAERRQLD